MFPGWALDRIDTGEAVLRVRRGGSGPPVLLLHGHPQTHVMWHKVGPRLAQHFTVVAPDLRGYGESSQPPTTADHAPYAKRAMARDMVALMNGLGFEQFAVVGHDRGARCAYRMALDHPHRVTRLAVLDIIPTAEAFRRMDRAFGLGYWHWFFLAQPADLPERLIGTDPDYYYSGRHPPRPYQTAEALADYRRAWHDPATVHAMCEDYRAGATLDVEHDEADRGRRRISCPTLLLWAGRGELGKWYDVLAVWREWAEHVQGGPLDCGHYMAEEAPEEVYAALWPFLQP
jgi:haloacetate dehalogenase